MDTELKHKRYIERYGAGLVAALGKATDRAVGSLFGMGHYKVARLRISLGIPPFTETYPEQCGRRRPKIVVTFDDMGQVQRMSDIEAAALFIKKFHALKQKGDSNG